MLKVHYLQKPSEPEVRGSNPRGPAINFILVFFCPNESLSTHDYSIFDPGLIEV